MKTSAVILAIAGAVAVSAQGSVAPAEWPECAKYCHDSMFAKAGSEFKCDVTDISCLCKDINFGYGLHDCGIENCKDNSVANLIIDWGRQLCAQAGVTINVPSASGNDIPIATSTFLSTITSSGTAVVFTSESTIFTDSVLPSDSAVSTPAASTSGSVVVSPIVSTGESGTTTVGSTTLETSAADATTTSTVSEDPNAATTTSSALAAQTAAPIVGILAAAGFAAALL